MSLSPLKVQHFELHAVLKRWARDFTPSEEISDRIVAMTIAAAIDEPTLLDGPSINEALYALLQEIAVEEAKPTVPLAKFPLVRSAPASQLLIKPSLSSM